MVAAFIAINRLTRGRSGRSAGDAMAIDAPSSAAAYDPSLPEQAAAGRYSRPAVSVTAGPPRLVDDDDPMSAPAPSSAAGAMALELEADPGAGVLDIPGILEHTTGSRTRSPGRGASATRPHGPPATAIPATVVLMELSGVERLVERLGPAAGDRLVGAVASTLRSEARATDRVTRLGPRRFGILLPETDEVEAINYIERVRAMCDRWLEAGAVALRSSIGWAQITADQGAEGALRTAEDRLDGERQRTGGS